MKRMMVFLPLAVSLLVVSVSVSAEASVRVGIGLGYGRPVFVPGPYWVPPLYYVLPVRSANSGELKVDTNSKDASVYINGAYAGTVREMKTIWLRSGTYNIEVRSTNGGVFDQKVFVPINKKVVIEPVFTRLPS